ncbi:MAG: DUF362 domain-containing protein [Deltaproteobacteria bacterium]
MIHKPDRREFLKGGLVTTAAALVGGSVGILSRGNAYAAQFPDVVVCHGQSPATITRAAVDALGGMKRFVKKGSKVVIKPNMSFARAPGTGSNTNPAVVAEVARMCVEAGASRIAVLDNVLQDPHDSLSLSQIPAYCRDIPKTMVSNVQARRFFHQVPVRDGFQVKNMEVIGEVADADVLIAVPVGKTHASAGVSLSMKGMMGLIYDRSPFHRRYNLHEAIVDMSMVLKPQLVVVDGTRILSTGGPGGPGKVIPLNLVIASSDMVAADAQMVSLGTWYGRKFKPTQVKHIRIAAQRGLGRADVENLNVTTLSA